MTRPSPAGTPVLRAPAIRQALRRVRWLWAAAGILSAVTLGVIAVLAATQPDQVNWVMWLPGIVITIACFAFIGVAIAAGRGSRGAYTRMRLVATVAPIGVVLLVVSPDDGYPVWMKAEQAVVAVFVALVAVILWSRPMRATFAPASTTPATGSVAR